MIARFYILTSLFYGEGLERSEQIERKKRERERKKEREIERERERIERES